MSKNDLTLFIFYLTGKFQRRVIPIYLIYSRINLLSLYLHSSSSTYQKKNIAFFLVILIESSYSSQKIISAKYKNYPQK